MSDKRQSRTGSTSNRRAVTTSVAEAERWERQEHDRIQAETERLWAAMGLKAVRP